MEITHPNVTISYFAPFRSRHQDREVQCFMLTVSFSVTRLDNPSESAVFLWIQNIWDNFEALVNYPFGSEDTHFIDLGEAIRSQSHKVNAFWSDCGEFEELFSLPSSLLVVSTVVSLVTGVGTGNTVRVIFSSHTDSQSLSFLPLPLLFPLLTVGPFLALLHDRQGSCVWD